MRNLILIYKYTKCRRGYQLFLNSSYPELAYDCWSYGSLSAEHLLFLPPFADKSSIS